ncbi:MAG: WecB/TagA/CpsF family glycosyltransferase [Patescibacteria group bacterium]|jgi:N-acetylglucosaminyldiphosphoundecaprenol N-acetyl-beta-D-mannosaminyltransferase
MENRKTIKILGTKVDCLTLPQALRRIVDLVRGRKNYYIVTPNPEMVMYADSHPWFKEVLNNADLALADGVGLQWAAKYLSFPLTKIPVLKQVQEFFQFIFTLPLVVLAPKLLNVIPERLTGADMVWEIAKLASERDYRIFLLGAGPGVALKAARTMQALYPQLNVVEIMVGPPYESQEEVIRAIQQTKPQFIFLAFPAEEQMRWMRDELPKLQDVIAIGIGGALDFIAGGTAINAGQDKSPAKRAPEWMRERGLEWFYRYITQPWRKKRIQTATIDFVKKVRQYKAESCT